MTPVFFRIAGGWVLGLPLVARGLTHMIVIYAFEYPGMWALRKLLGSSPSEANYYLSRWNVHGLIRLDFAPLWFTAGLAMELFYRRLH